MAALFLPRAGRSRRLAVTAVSLLALAGLACGTAATARASDAGSTRASDAGSTRHLSTGTGCPRSVTGNAASGTAAAGTSAAVDTAAATDASTASWNSAGVPWRNVGRGWILAEVASSPSGNGPQTLSLVSPGGQRYRLGTVAAGAVLEDWSGNSTNALLLNQNLNSTKASIIVLNLKTGKVGGFTAYTGTPYPQVSFTRPDGTAILF